MVAMGVLIVTLGLLLPLLSGAGDIGRVREVAARNNVTCVLVFGDSSVDPGNNNVLPTFLKGNFLPYGKDFFNGRPTGRFSNGRLATDFIADALGHTKIIPAFLDPNMKLQDLPHGVSFASAGSGYDDLTANISSVLSLPRQLKYFLHYKVKLIKLVGQKKAEDIIRTAVLILSMGTNDFVQNYYLDPTRPKQFSVEEYQNYLVSCMANGIQQMERIGATRLVVVGVPPLGCMPLVKTLMDVTACAENYNKVAFSLSSRIQKKLEAITKTSRMKIGFVDAYGIMQNAINNPKLYDLAETSKGCCGTGAIELGDSCRGLETCTDPAKYVFWDAVHPTEKMYKIIADKAVETLSETLFV
ncbi:hypothetical protein ACFX2C_004950 [Malus domestica]